jgi:transcriptional regulator with XRE-family HTH domain
MGSQFLAGGPSLSSINPDLYAKALDGLIAARKSAAITQVDLAKSLGRPQSFVSKYEAGERRLDVAEYVVISRVLGCDPYKLLRRAETSS